jgi:hypothetical protein
VGKSDGEICLVSILGRWMLIQSIHYLLLVTSRLKNMENKNLRAVIEGKLVQSGEKER